MKPPDFSTFFRTATGKPSPYRYQCRLALLSYCDHTRLPGHDVVMRVVDQGTRPLAETSASLPA